MNPARKPEYLARQEERIRGLRQNLASLDLEREPFVWEVGCGHGHFLTAYASSQPAKTCIGIDIVRDRIDRATRKRNRAGLGGLHFILAEASDFFAALPEEAKFSEIFVLFPDPWPKRRHHKNRLIQPDFLHRAAARAGKGSRLYFRTDYAPYFAEAAAIIRAHPHWEVINEPWPFELETVFQARALSYQSLVATPRPARS